MKRRKKKKALAAIFILLLALGVVGAIAALIPKNGEDPIEQSTTSSRHETKASDITPEADHIYF